MKKSTFFQPASIFFIFLLVGYCYPAAARITPAPYWQQTVNYDLKVSLDETNHSLKGFETFTYTNHSPDTLSFIWIHCWPNAYKDNTTALYRQLSIIEERKEKLKRIKENGYISQLAFTADGMPLMTTPHPLYADILQLILPRPLPPGSTITISTPFFVKIPSYFSRLGHEGKSYMITQWYPKPAVYDSKGWHEMPYLDQGEFYSEYGSYDVQITLPASYVVGATGMLTTTAESEAYKHTGRPAQWNVPTKTLDYHAEHVHDFAWFADQHFIVRYDTLQLPSGKIIDVFSYYRPGSINKEWNNSLTYIKDAVLHYSNWVGEYDYPVVSAVEGPGNTSSGGMEYPMITLITSPRATQADLDGVIAHEVGHNWFYGMLGSNEREHPWMDEGINTYYEFRYEAEKYRSNGILGGAIPSNIKKLGTEDFLDAIYNVIDQLKAVKPIETPAPDFSSEFDYGLVVYARTACWMHVLERELGKATLEKGMKNYFSEWKFKHPYPENFQASLEEVTHSSLDKLFALLNSTDQL